jgi:hypothetical protein
VFISHATADKWIAKVICEKLEAVGATTFLDDRDIHGGDNIPDVIRREIRRSSEVLVLLTPQSIGREWIRIEIGAAWGRGKKRSITPILYHVDVSAVPVIIQLTKAFPLNEFDRYLDELRQRLRGSRR